MENCERNLYRVFHEQRARLILLRLSQISFLKLKEKKNHVAVHVCYIDKRWLFSYFLKLQFELRIEFLNFQQKASAFSINTIVYRAFAIDCKFHWF